MIYTPRKNPKKAAYVSGTSFALAVALYTVGEFLPSGRMLFQILALLALAFAIMLVSRYLLTDYKYVIRDAERIGQETSFSIIKISGKRETPVANFDFVSVYAFKRCKGAREFEKEHGRVDKVYNYSSNFMSEDACAMAINFNSKKVLLIIEADEIFERDIKARIPSPDSEEL
jgi:hypothetical protein